MASEPTVNILLVDDNPATLLAYEAALEGPGVKLFKAATGQAALDLLAGEDFALVLLDVNMPVMSGFQVMERLKAQERSKDTPVIFSTATYKTQAVANICYGLGAADVLFEPVEVEVLRAKVKAFVDRYREKKLGKRGNL